MRTVSFYGHKLPLESLELCSIPLRFNLRVIPVRFVALQFYFVEVQLSVSFHFIPERNVMFHFIRFVTFDIFILW